MATKLFCDRCDTEATRVIKVTIEKTHVANDSDTVELCESCRDSLTRWLREAPARAMRRDVA
jgi:hypothetical protein